MDSQLHAAAFTADQIAECKLRFTQSGFTDYDTWCRAYIALNSTKPADDTGLHLDGNLIIKALASQPKPKPLFKVSKNKYK